MGAGGCLVVPAVIGLVLVLAACGGGSPSRGAVRATGTAPPPLTVLTRDTSERQRGHLHRPGRRRLPGGPRDRHHRREGGLVPPAARRGNCHRLPHSDLPGPAGPHLVPVSPAARANPPARGPRTPGGPGGTGVQVSPDGPSGTDYIYNDRYQQVATVRAGNGDANTFHEFLITPWDTALIVVDTTTTANLTSIGGPTDQRVIDGLVQEIDIKTGRVLFEWDSAAHVPYADSYTPGRPPRARPGTGSTSTPSTSTPTATCW